MKKTIFAGLTVLRPAEPLSTDNFSFTGRDREVIDRWLEVGARTHRHDGHAALADPVTAPAASAVSSAGAIPADYTLYIGYTLVDSDGRGETTLSEQATVTTVESLDSPEDAPEGTFVSSAGTLNAGLYYYAMTFLDGQGGETSIGPFVDVDRPPGYEFGCIVLTGMGAIASAASADGWNLYRSRNGEEYKKVATGEVFDDEVIDAGVTTEDCLPPPEENTTHGANSIEVVVPLGLASAASAFRLYTSIDGTFASPCLVGEFPLASAGDSILIETEEVDEGAPPDVSTCAAGASLIDPDTELLDWTWKRPVDSAGDLPGAAGEGDARVTLDDGHIHVYFSGAWQDATTGGGGGGAVASGGGYTVVSTGQYASASASTSASAYVNVPAFPPLVASLSIDDADVDPVTTWQVEIYAALDMRNASGNASAALFINEALAVNESGDNVIGSVASGGVYEGFVIGRPDGVSAQFATLGVALLWTPDKAMGQALTTLRRHTAGPDVFYINVELRYQCDAGTMEVRNQMIYVRATPLAPAALNSP